MDFEQTIITILGLQDVTIEDVKIFRKQRRIEVRVRQKRSQCFCPHCGHPFSKVKEWELKHLKAPPLGVFQFVTIKFFQMRGECECSAPTITTQNFYKIPETFS